MTTTIPERLAALDTLTLDRGQHGAFEAGHCAMEVVAWLAGEGHTDAPECASPVLRTFTIGLNDRWGDAQRQRLAPFLPRMVGTAGDGQDEARSYLALDWQIRTFTPAWLELAGLTGEATALRDLPRIDDQAAAEGARPVVEAGREKAATAWDAARGAAEAAAWDAARGTAWAAGEDAAGEAAWAAAQGAAQGAAWDTARDAARGAALGGALDAARGAALRGALAALRPTVEILQTSALDLLDRMIDPSAEATR